MKEVSGGALELTVQVARPYDARPLLAYLAARSITGLECVEGEWYRRVARIGDELRILTVDFSRASTGGVIFASCTPGNGLDPESVRRIVVALTDADAPIVAVKRRLSKDQALVSLVQRYPGARIPGTVDPFELAVRAILGQQVSVGTARTFASRLVVSWGDTVDRGHPGLIRAFPTPAQLAGASLDEVGLSKTRAGAIRELCDAVLTRRFDLRPDRSVRISEESLCSIKGIGPWTAAYIALRGLGDRDAIPLGDLGLRQALEGGEACPERTLAVRAEKWRPWRGYAAVHLWNTFLGL